MRALPSSAHSGVVAEFITQPVVLALDGKGDEHLSRLFRGEWRETNCVEEAEERMGVVGEISVQARGAAYYEYIGSRLKEVAQLLLTLFPQGVKNLVEVLRENENRSVLLDDCAQSSSASSRLWDR